MTPAAAMRPPPSGLSGTAAPARCALAAAGLGWVLSALAAGPGLPDPTRPPPGLVGVPIGHGEPAVPPLVMRPAAAAPAPAASAAAPPPPPPPPEPLPQLQSLQMSGNGKGSALIDGRLVRAGDSVGSRRVVAIDAEGVSLQGTGGIERLPLLAGAPKQPAGTISISRSTAFAAAPAPAASAPLPAGVTAEPAADAATATAPSAADVARATPPSLPGSSR